MNKSELVEALADRTGMSKADASRAVDALFDVKDGIIVKGLRKNDRVQITGFGTFEAKRRKARTGRNPRTGETIKLSPKKTAAFRAGKPFKMAVGGHHGDPQTDPPPRGGKK